MRKETFFAALPVLSLLAIYLITVPRAAPKPEHQLTLEEKRAIYRKILEGDEEAARGMPAPPISGPAVLARAVALQGYTAALAICKRMIDAAQSDKELLDVLTCSSSANVAPSEPDWEPEPDPRE